MRNTRMHSSSIYRREDISRTVHRVHYKFDRENSRPDSLDDKTREPVKISAKYRSFKRQKNTPNSADSCSLWL